jgi:hypothetical protein
MLTLYGGSIKPKAFARLTHSRFACANSLCQGIGAEGARITEAGGRKKSPVSTESIVSRLSAILGHIVGEVLRVCCERDALQVRSSLSPCACE